MYKHLIIYFLIFSTTSHALPNNIGMQFEETFNGYFCAYESRPENCEPWLKTDNLSIYFHLKKESANKFFIDLDLQMDVFAKISFKSKTAIAQPGIFIINDYVEEKNMMLFSYEFEYSDSGHNYKIDIRKIFYQDERDENMWDDLTTMYITRKEKFGTSTYIPAGSGIIRLPDSLFIILKWLAHFKSIDGSFSEDLEIQAMAFDYFILDKFNKIYNGRPITN